MMFDAPRILQGMGKVLTFGPWAASLQRWQQIALFFQATLKSTRRLDSQTDLESRELKMPKLYRCIPNHPKSHSFASYESWVVPAGVPSDLADIGGGVGANN